MNGASLIASHAAERPQHPELECARHASSCRVRSEGRPYARRVSVVRHAEESQTSVTSDFVPASTPEGAKRTMNRSVMQSETRLKLMEGKGIKPASPEAIKELQQGLKGKMILAPLTRGGNLPFRQLCCQFGPGSPTVGEMAYARNLTKKRPDFVELARLRRATNEDLFGVQIATKQIDEGVRAAYQAV